MKIREYAKLVGFEVVGRISYAGMWDLNNRFYMDEARNIYLIDTAIGGVRIIPHRQPQPDLPGYKEKGQCQ